MLEEAKADNLRRLLLYSCTGLYVPILHSAIFELLYMSYNHSQS